MLMAASVTIEDLVVRGHVHDEHMTDAAARAQAGLSCHDRTEELVGVQAAFHQELGLALSNQLHRLCCRGMAVRRVDDASVAKVDAVGRRNFPKFCSRADENGDNQPLLGGLDGARERCSLARMRHCRCHRLKTAAPRQQCFVLSRSSASIHGFLVR